MARTILIRPLITEKSEMLSDRLNQYTFVVDKKANKLQIKDAIEEMYNVAVESVNTIIVPGKLKTRSTRSGLLKGRKPSYKKAVVTLTEGEEIDFFGEI
ncbi:MAG: 50S ribosomal protein L23 [Bacteroidota bacterium]